MPRTSYGDDKRSQAWEVVTNLLQSLGASEQVTVGSVKITRCNQDNTPKLSLKVQGTLSDLGKLSSLSIEQVRESLAEHLMKYLEIVDDQRSQKAGRNAGNWTFVLRLWSVDLEENKQRFWEEWDARKSGNRLQTKPIPKIDPITEVRARVCQKIQEQHSKIRLLNLNEIGVDQLYVDVWVLQRLSSSLQVRLESFYQTFDLRGDRIGIGDRIRRKAGFTIAEIEPKLLILGKPGAGKTTFLKHLLVDCCNERFQPNLIPVFLELRSIQTQEYDLLLAIHREFGLSELQQTEQLLKQGKGMILLDGLDEVPGQYRQTIQNRIRDFAQDYSKNRFILTCRTSILECPPQGFECVEVADFQPHQVEEFVKNWFKAGGMDDARCGKQWNAFYGRLKESPAVHELTVTPVVLSLMCWVFEDAGDLPTQRSQLYRKGLDLLLRRWDKSRDIQREVGSEIYRKLSLKHKESLLSELAAWKFTQSDNFVLFEQAKLVEKITKLLGLDDEEEGERVLKAIEAHHGLLIQRTDDLWSFSHLTFQEYFTTQWFIQRQEWQELACNIWTPHWREIFLLVTEQREYSTEILWAMKAEIDQSIAGDSKLQGFLAWAQQKSESAHSQYKTAKVRAFYFDLAYELNGIEQSDSTRSLRSLVSEIMYDLDINASRAFGSKVNSFRKQILSRQKGERRRREEQEIEEEEPSRVEKLNLEKTRFERVYKSLNYACDCVLAFNRHTVLDSNSQDPMSLDELMHIEAQLPEFVEEDFYNSWIWWESNGEAWTEQLRQALIKYCNIGHDWQFTVHQKEQLRRYYAANKFLIECMYQPGAVNETVQGEIEDNLFLPIAELQRQQNEKIEI
jgi:predicted NACHT family NTPase